MEKIESLKHKTVSGLFWRFGERITAQFISFVVSMILARILLPKDYGIVAIVTIFINLANSLVVGGLGSALVQKKDADVKDFSTIYIASFIMSLIMYIILFFAAPVISNIYENQLLTPVLRVMGIRLIIAAINSVQQAYVQRKMIYKKFFLSTLVGTIISAIVGIIMAIRGFGVWSLVAQYLINSTIDTIILFITIDLRPKLYFSFKEFKAMFKFGSRIMFASFIGTLFDQLRGLLIGVRYTTEDLAYYSKGEQIPSLLANNINQTIDSVLFSSISKIQEDKIYVKNAIRRMMQVSSFIIMPIMFGIFGVAESFIRIVLTEKWLFCIPFIRIVCIQQCFSILGTVNLQAIKAVGRSDIILKLEFIKKPIYLLILILCIFINPLAVCIGCAAYCFIAIFINAKPNKDIINYTLKEQFFDTFPYFIISLTMGGFVMILGFLNINIYIVFGLQILFGIVFYISISKLLNLQSYKYIIDMVRRKLNDKKNNKKI